MKTIRVFLALMVLIPLAFGWTPRRAKAEEYYTQDEQNRKIIKEGVVGAGVGAISAGASGGSAGKGALIGAGTNVIGSAVLDTLTAPPRTQPQVQYVQQAPERVQFVSNDAPAPRRGCSR